MKYFELLIILIGLCFWTNAQQKEVNNGNVEPMDIYQVLKKQISYGYDSPVPQKNNQDDINATFIIVDSILQSSGYQKCSDIEFKQKVKRIFGFTDEQCKNEGFAFYILSNMSRCNPFPSDYLYILQDGGTQGSAVFYISFKHQLLTPFLPIPSLIDYSKKYPQIADFETSMSGKAKYHSGKIGEITKWKEIKELNIIRQQSIQYLSAINSYLFNNNRAFIPYLLLKEPTFVEGLVKEYGYTKEPAFNKFMLEKYAENGSNKNSDEFETDFKTFGETIFSRDCNKHLVIRTDLLDYIAQNTDSSNAKMMSALFYYMADVYKGYTFAERCKIFAYASIVFDKYFLDKSENLHSTGLSGRINIPLLGLLLHYEPKAEEEIKSHNYYNIKGLNDLIARVKKNWLDDFLYKNPY